MARLRQGTYYGRMARRLDAGSVLLTENVHRPGVTLPLHAHERSYFRYVAAGAFEERWKGGMVHCGAGDVRFVPGGFRHANRFGSDGGCCLNVELSESDADRFDLPVCSRGTSATLISALPIMLRMWRESREPDPLSPMVIEAMAVELLAEGVRAARRDVRGGMWLDRADEILRARFVEPPSLFELAAEVDVHPTHLARAFRKRYGCTVGERVRMLRIRHACELLTRTRWSVAAVAIASGFVDQAHLSRWMRRSLGVTPGAFRASKKV